MDIILFIYNILLIILYTCPLVQLINLYLSKKQPIYLNLSILFSLYILDNILIYMTEFFDSFSSIYNLQFMSIPSIKTIIIISTTLVYFVIHKNVFNKNLKPIDYITLTLFTVSLLVIPLILDGAVMVWSYYLPYQLISIYIAYSGLKHLKSNSDLFKEFPLMCIYKKILIYTFIFSVIIIIEDTLVIFSFDVYSNLMVKINNRSISENILSIIYSIYAIKYCHISFNSSYNNLPLTNSKSIHELNTNTDAIYKFSSFYNLTKREQEILIFLLDSKTNQEISDLLFISIGTTKTHIHNIFQKVDISKRNQLILKYNEFQNNIINSEC